MRPRNLRIVVDFDRRSARGKSRRVISKAQLLRAQDRDEAATALLAEAAKSRRA